MGPYIYRLGSTSNILGRPPNFYRGSDLLSKGLKFGSVYAVTAETAHSIEKVSQTCEGFKGLVWSQRLWVDFDTYEAGQEAIKKLIKEAYDFVVYDTGGRGMHIGIARVSEPCHTLPQQDKAWVSSNLAGADLSLYWHLHLIRLPGTVHEKTGKPKTLILREAGRSLQLPGPKENSDLGRSYGYSRPSISEPGREEGRSLLLPPLHKGTEHYDLERASRLSMGEVQRQPKLCSHSSIFSSWEVMNLLQPTGERKQLVDLAKALQRAGATKDWASNIVHEVNAGFNPPRDRNDVSRIVEWAFNE